MRAPNIRVDIRTFLSFEHDLFGKPVSTFPDHALCSPEQFGGTAHRGDDIEISGAAAEIA
jgi:hypothetical protein